MDNINWDTIPGMEKGRSVVYLIDCNGDPVKNDLKKQIAAVYLGNRRLRIINVDNPASENGVEGSADDLAMLFINSYSYTRRRMRDVNGDKCWTFKRLRICDYKKYHSDFIELWQSVN